MDPAAPPLPPETAQPPLPPLPPGGPPPSAAALAPPLPPLPPGPGPSSAAAAAGAAGPSSAAAAAPSGSELGGGPDDAPVLGPDGMPVLPDDEDEDPLVLAQRRREAEELAAQQAAEFVPFDPELDAALKVCTLCAWAAGAGEAGVHAAVRSILSQALPSPLPSHLLP